MRFRAHICACKPLHNEESASTAGIWLRTPRRIRTVLADAVSGQELIANERRFRESLKTFLGFEGRILRLIHVRG